MFFFVERQRQPFVPTEVFRAFAPNKQRIPEADIALYDGNSGFAGACLSCFGLRFAGAFPLASAGFFGFSRLFFNGFEFCFHEWIWIILL